MLIVEIEAISEKDIFVIAEAKYGKYSLNELTKDEREKGFGRNPSFHINTDIDIITGCSENTTIIV